uniref:Uncharacterized protein n=1 Tax=viral metagenome TaxID=1070528 RepID=A0A6C0KVY8_9ZZZZ
MSVLTTFRVIDKEATEIAFERALAAGAFSQPYHILTANLKDSLSDMDNVDLLSFSYPLEETIELVARNHMMISIGTSICLINERIPFGLLGAIRHTVGIQRMGTPKMWQLVDVYWLEEERCPFRFQMSL